MTFTNKPSPLKLAEAITEAYEKLTLKFAEAASHTAILNAEWVGTVARLSAVHESLSKINASQQLWADVSNRAAMFAACSNSFALNVSSISSPAFFTGRSTANMPMFSYATRFRLINLFNLGIAFLQGWRVHTL